MAERRTRKERPALLPLIVSNGAAALALLVGMGAVADDYWRGGDVTFAALLGISLVVLRYFMPDEEEDDDSEAPPRGAGLPGILLRGALLLGAVAASGPLADGLDLRPDSFGRIALVVGTGVAAFALMVLWERTRRVTPRIVAGLLITVAGVLLVIFVNVVGGIAALVVGVGLLLPFTDGELGGSTEWSGDSWGGGGDGGGF